MKFYLIDMDPVVYPEDPELWPEPVPFDLPAMDSEDKREYEKFLKKMDGSSNDL